jgi:hypothetical protein
LNFARDAQALMVAVDELTEDATPRVEITHVPRLVDVPVAGPLHRR